MSGDTPRGRGGQGHTLPTGLRKGPQPWNRGWKNRVGDSFLGLGRGHSAGPGAPLESREPAGWAPALPHICPQVPARWHLLKVRSAGLALVLRCQGAQGPPGARIPDGPEPSQQGVQLSARGEETRDTSGPAPGARLPGGPHQSWSALEAWGLLSDTGSSPGLPGACHLERPRPAAARGPRPAGEELSDQGPGSPRGPSPGPDLPGSCPVLGSEPPQ